MSEPERIILVGIDESEHSERAFNYYVTNIQRKDDTVVLVNVKQNPHPPLLTITTGNFQEWQKLIKEVDAKANNLLKRYASLCENAGLKHKAVLKDLSGGTVGEVLVKSSEEENAKLIVAGSRGQNIIRRTILGSVSDYIVHHSHRPILVVPPPRTNT